MARYSSGVLTGVGSLTLPFISLYAGASASGLVREIGIFNRTAIAIEIFLSRLTTTGTQGAVLTEASHDDNAGPALMSAFATHTVAPTLGADLGYRSVLGAAIGSGIIWTFGDRGLRVPEGATNGIGILVESGSGQSCQAYIVWDE